MFQLLRRVGRSFLSGEMFDTLSEPFAAKSHVWRQTPVSKRMRRYVRGWQYREMNDAEQWEDNELSMW